MSLTLREHLQQVEGAVKVFPLASAALLPHAVLPLHIFEPRYRDMVRDTLAAERVIAIAQLSPGWQQDYEGRPAIDPLVCVGLVVWHEVLENGRYNLLLQGACRARVLEELPAQHSYREVRIELLPDPEDALVDDEGLRRMVLELCGRLPMSLSEGLLPLAARAKGGALADVVAAAVIQDPGRRHALLTELDVQTRIGAVTNDVAELMARLVPAGELGGPPN